MDAGRLAGTMPIAAGDRVGSPQLAQYLADTIGGCEGAMTVSRFRGGQSNPTYLVSFAGGRRLVLRKKPDGKLLPSAHAVDREYRVIRALEHTDVPVARAHLLCDDETLVGTVFYVMDYVPGRTFWDPALPGLSRGERRRVFAEMSRVIAALHSLDVSTLGLAGFGKTDNYMARQVARWTTQYLASETEPIPAMHFLIGWLPANLPPENPSVLIHGDFRLDNVIFDRESLTIRAVLDWELSTLGDPVADFACHMLTWHLPAARLRGLADVDLVKLGIPGEAAHRAAYFKALGRPEPSERTWNIYLAYSLFRVAAIRQGIMRRAVDGTASSRHAREAGALARPVAELAVKYAERACNA